MKKTSPRILIIDDENAICTVLSASLRDEGYQVETARDGLSGIQAIGEFKPAVVLLDIWMPGELDGLEVLKRARDQFPGSQYIIMSGHGTIETAVRATKLGAWDFVEKPLSIDKILIIIKNILSYETEKSEKGLLLNRLRKNIAIIGESKGIVILKDMIARVAPSDSWILIGGENGTGKELVAQNIHYLSKRAGRPLVEVNCAAIPKDLVESELFGYEKGAFTGAEVTRKGKFDLANGGTLFLDEIADMNLDAQAKILRILQERKFHRVGGNETIEADVRVVAATNKNLEEEIREGRFREDLYYRLNVIPFMVPPLRERREDIPGLILHFGDQIAAQGGHRRKIFSEKTLEKMQAYTWPGNVRELRNFIERLYILTPGDYVEVHDLRFAGMIERAENLDGSEVNTFREARARFEKEFLLKRISENKGNISKTAEVIGLERSYLHRKIKSYGIDI
ncbi:MAG: sigma-54-dependent Fis family transcriptional regulator [Bdellovibrionales bacterium]|jgi:two-component system nitrogen regulation response regulator NtrX|nr:sigma-54-dependent Fis family transcriptional regulator [Bdellovibrionales bacterium]